ncbi:type I methionyl aminopeptidase [Egicoccus halophilus]|uniref:Methionine aminopeptidase n=1 Tax=Egicoccus halophilus TaxID=1670830 RepID=A0A8J3AA43_9ACTN|nr:type I methionyl aminopeptidase [Egicoccus halophilus]GGI05868.1 methionine aminopeptidase [Egicoccus halophilus]
MILKKTADDIAKMARAGAVVAKVHEELVAALRPGMSTLDLDRIAEKVVVGAGAVPSFKGYRGFPATLCTSKNQQIVHGIPSKDVVLDEGDVISIDAGAIVDGFHGDSATTLIVGGEDTVDPAVATLVRETRNALWRGLAEVRDGNRLGDVGAAIEAVADTRGYGVVREYVGHGIGRSLHEDPSVPNYGRPGRGLKLTRGWVIAVEPMFNLGTEETETLDDGWTVVTADGAVSAHWEHTIAITADGPVVLTARSDEPSHLLEATIPSW